MIRLFTLCLFIAALFQSSFAQQPSPRSGRPTPGPALQRWVASAKSAQSRSDDTTQNLATEIRRLSEAQRWEDVVQTLQPIPDRSADLDYAYGIALAKLRRMDEANTVFLSGRKLQPNDPRFPVELAGIAFQQKQYAVAERWLMLAHRIAPHDSYINDFLGTVFYLQANLQAAVKYWNLVGKPYVENVRTGSEFRVDPVVLDRAETLSPGSVLNLSELLTTETRLRGLGIFPSYSWDLAARPDGKFDATLNAIEKNGFGANKWASLFSTFGSAIFMTVTPEYANIRGSATNFASQFRFDPEKRRAAASLSGPLRRDPRWRYRVGVDLRNENWTVKNFSALATTSLGSLNMQRAATFADVTSLNSGKWNWSTGAELSYRNFRNVSTASSFTPDLLLQGIELKHRAQLNYELLRLPEKRLVVSSNLSSQLGRLWQDGGYSFFTLQGGIADHWFPQATGDDYEMQHRVRFGKTVGTMPFDELFVLGVDRDSDLLMRAHVGTYHKRKGNAPMGRNYFVSNWEIDKNAYRNGLFTVKLGPFVDTGKITDPLDYLGTQKWLLDAGGQAKFRTFGVQLIVGYGRDLRSGKDAFFAYIAR